MSILIHGYFVLEFLSSGHWLFFGPLSRHLIFRTNLKNLDRFLFLMLDKFGSFSVSNVGWFFKYEEFQSDLFQVSILFDWYGLKFRLKLVKWNRASKLCFKYMSLIRFSIDLGISNSTSFVRKYCKYWWVSWWR